MVSVYKHVGVESALFVVLQNVLDNIQRFEADCAQTIFLCTKVKKSM